MASRKLVGPAVVVGSALEWFDFYLFASMAALVFGPVFFPSQSSVAGTLAAIATFAVGYVVRPLGGVFFGALGDRIGRRRVLSWTFVLMGLSSAMIGLIPSYATIGVLAPILLVVLRLLQGFGAGAEFGSAVVVAYEHAEVRTRGRLGSWPALGVNIGLFAASLTVTLVTSTDKHFLDTWGWRVPFLASFALVLVGLWVRRGLPESPEYEKAAAHRRRTSTPLRTLLRDDWRGLLVVGSVTVGYVAASYTFKTFSLSYLTEFRGVPANVGAFGITLASGVAILTVPVAGRLTDRFDARAVLLAGAVAVAVLAVPFFWALDSGSPVLIWGALICTTGLVVPAMLAASGSYFAQQFPTSVRVSGVSVGRETAGVAGGLAPLLALALVADTPGHATWPVVSMFVASALLIAAGAVCDQAGRATARDELVAT